MTSKRLIIELCPDPHPALAVIYPGGGKCNESLSVDTVAKRITFEIKADKGEPGRIEIPIFENGLSDFYSCGDLDNCISIERDPITDFFDNIQYMEPYPTITMQHHGHCLWTDSVLTALLAGNPPGGETIAHVRRTDRDDCEIVCDGYDGHLDHVVISNEDLVPGMQVDGRHFFEDGKYKRMVICGYLYWHTCSMTGGEVKAVRGTYDEIDIRYDVEAEGVLITDIQSSDFVDYAVGDWVFLMLKTDECIMDCDMGRSIPISYDNDGNPNPIDGADFVIVPFEIGGRGA